MGADPSLVSLVTGAVGLGLVGVSSAPATLRLFKKLPFSSHSSASAVKYDSKALYEDEDGVASEETQAEFFNWLNSIPKYGILVFSLLGFGVATAAAVWATLHPSTSLYLEQWLLFGAWVSEIHPLPHIQKDSQNCRFNG